jgi:anti-sigma factor RsiW
VDHRRTEALLATYAMGASPAEDRPAIEAHLSACPACCTEVQALVRAWDEVRRQVHTSDAERR